MNQPKLYVCRYIGFVYFKENTKSEFIKMLKQAYPLAKIQTVEKKTKDNQFIELVSDLTVDTIIQVDNNNIGEMKKEMKNTLTHLFMSAYDGHIRNLQDVSKIDFTSIIEFENYEIQTLTEL